MDRLMGLAAAILAPVPMISRLIAVLATVSLMVQTAGAGDWPMWRYDARRGSSSPHQLPDQLHLHWSRQLPKPLPAWPAEQSKLQFDVLAEPVVLGQRILVPSSRHDSITAFDTRGGQELWRFYAGGPVRFAPAAHNGKVYFNSDDGYLYCLDAADGSLKWKVKGAPGKRRILGNHRLISSWPARGGVVPHQGRLFFTAGIWPFMGIFVHAVDPDSGEIIWTNSGGGAEFTVQPHEAPSFAGLVPQGHLAAAGDSILIPGGRSTPGLYDASTGRQRLFNYDKRLGGHDVGIAEDLIFVSGRAFSRENGRPVGGGAPAIFDSQRLIASDPDAILCRYAKVGFNLIKKFDPKGKVFKELSPRYRQVFKTRLAAPIPGRWFLKAGERYYAGGEGTVAAYEQGNSEPVWQATITGTAATMLAADNRLFVVTEDNWLHCFGAAEVAPKRLPLEVIPLAEQRDEWTQRAAAILSRDGAGEGYAIVLGIGSGRLIEELLMRSNLHVIVVEPDPAKVFEMRSRMTAAALYGSRIAVIQDDPARARLPAYLANLMVSESADSLRWMDRLYETLRPYGGFAWVPNATGGKAYPAGAAVARDGLGTWIIRDGALPGADDWTHQYANAAQTVVSSESLVKAPFGVLWFGGPPHHGVLPRHGHGPSPQVAGGRLFIEGPDLLRAVDVYTGRLLWQRELKGFGAYYDTTKHFPGAGEIGSNYVSLADRVYAVYGSVLLKLDARDGQTLREFRLPAPGPDQPAPYWGHVSVCGDYLIATSTPVDATPAALPAPRAGRNLPPGRYGAGSRRLVVFEQSSGRQLWSRQAVFNFRHNNIAVSGDTLFCIDRLTRSRAQVLRRRGLKLRGEATLYALDLPTGEVIWQRHDAVFGTFLNYSAEHDVLLQGGSAFRDRAKDEVAAGLMALRGRDGSILWHRPGLEYHGPCMLWRDQVITNGVNGFALNLLTGGESGWGFTRMYGCNTAVGSEHLITFRSGAAGFFDLAKLSGVGNLGGFRSGCTNNLIPANGVLNAPDYTRTCTCAYQNQTSLALIHMPEAEFWTFGGQADAKRIGINFGAPGDRRSESGTLFREYPPAGNEPDTVKVSVKGAAVRYPRSHASLIRRGKLPWLTASAVQGAQRISIKFHERGPCRVRLWFAELEKVGPGERVFDVWLAGKPVMEGFDVAAEAGRSVEVTREFTGVEVAGDLEIELRPLGGSLPALLCAVEIVFS